MTLMDRVAEVFAALKALDNAPDEMKAAFLRGAAAAFAACWRGLESEHCLAAAEAFAGRPGETSEIGIGPQLKETG